MTRIFAIARLTIKTAIHSRVFITLLAAVVICVAGFPMIVKGDGTLEGELKLILKYSLSSAVILLSFVSIWAGSASVAMEIAGKQIHLIRAKPVSTIQLWLGKWLGIVTLNAVLLLCAAGLTYAMTIRSVSTAQRAGKDTTTARQTILESNAVIFPLTPQRDTQAAPAVPEPGAGDAIEAMRQDLTYERRTVEFGDSMDWNFIIPPQSLEKQRNFSVIFSFIASINPEEHVNLQWLIEKEGVFETVFSESIYGAGEHRFNLPSTIIPDNRILNLRLKYLPKGDRQSLLFPDDDSVKITFQKGSFTGNFIKSAFVLLFKLAALSALGLTAGCLFSFPVASFVSFSTIIVYALVSFFTWQEGGLGVDLHDHHSSPTEGLAEHLGTHLIIFISRILSVLRETDVLSMLASGTFIPWTFFLRIFTAHILVVCGTLCLLGCLVFRKRELAI